MCLLYIYSCPCGFTNEFELHFVTLWQFVRVSLMQFQNCFQYILKHKALCLVFCSIAHFGDSGFQECYV